MIQHFNARRGPTQYDTAHMPVMSDSEQTDNVRLFDRGAAPEHIRELPAINDTEMRFKRSMRDAFPTDYATSALEHPERPHVTRTEFVQVLVGAVCVLGLLVCAWWWPR